MLPTNRTVLCLLCAAMLSPLAGSVTRAADADRIRPYSGNPTYWQYKGKPVMLLGGSKTDHIFLLDDLKEHLDEIHSVGANYVRNTMSQREGIALKPHKLLPDGKFDLDQWNEEYWRRFQNMLKWTSERDIIVQIEIWDRFDFSQRNWDHSPWNPDNNVNYTYAQTGFAAEYPAHPGQDRQPFFHSINNNKIYSGGNDEEAVARMFRIIFAGGASARFHRPHPLEGTDDHEKSTQWGLGLSPRAQATLRAARTLTEAMNVFACEPRNDLLSERSPNEAYCPAEPGRQYAVYFPNGGQVKLDLSAAGGTFQLRWLDIDRNTWHEAQTIRGGGTPELNTPGNGHWATLILRRL